MVKSRSVITPWKVSGDVNYKKLIKEFGTEPITEEIQSNLKKAHPVLRRGLFFSHREFDLWLRDAHAKKKVSIVSGRGPSEKMHIGHLIPFLASKSLQEIYNCNVFIPISEDEKFFVKPSLSLENAKKFAEDNILDILALGFKPGKTFILRDFSNSKIYEWSAKLSKLITYSEAKAVFGLKPENNIGWSFYPAVQAAHILLPQFVEGAHKTLVPVGIDQDPFIRLTRDKASNSALKFIKPAAIHGRFLPGLKGEAKMSSSDSEGTNLIYLSDSPHEVKNKINRYAFSGGKDTLDEHRKHGGNPDIDISFQYLKFFFEESDKKLQKIHDDYKSGTLTTGELKAYTIKKISSFLEKHQKAKQAAKAKAKKFMMD